MLRTVMALCAAEVLGMAGAFAFPALLPAFRAEWALSNTDAGWISGIYFGGYALAVPVLTALTDRVDARRVWLAGMLVTAAAAAGFAWLAGGFWSAMAFRALGGVGLAGTYMPGLKALVDRSGGPRQPQWISWYTASFSLGTSGSFLVAGAAAAAWGWRAAYGVAAVSALAAALLVLAALRPMAPVPPARPVPLLDFRPVLRRRRVVGYILAYAAHTWELFGLRSWMVAFLAAAAAVAPASAWPGPTGLATLASLVAMAASIGGAELAVRFDRRRVCGLAAAGSAAMAAGLGFILGWSYAWVAALMLLYNALVQLDSAALTTGAVLEAEPDRRGATIAVHSLLGFGAGFAGPLAFGWVLDLAGGGAAPGAWGLAFLSLAAVAALAPLALKWSRPEG
jgi:MFS family permease